jgi:hypothetical protein
MVALSSLRSPLEDVLTIQGVHNSITKKIAFPLEANTKDGKLTSFTSNQGYNPEDSASEWDALSNIDRCGTAQKVSEDLGKDK